MPLVAGLACLCQLAAAGPVDALTADRLVVRARAARYQQDSALADYRVLARQRWTGAIGIADGLGLGPVGRMRLAARFETVARMYWHHTRGAFAELIASRAVAPIAGELAPEPGTEDIMFVLPYAPGREQLWPMSELREALDTGRDWIVHPLDAGADSLYAFALGGPLTITLPSGLAVRLQELHVRPRRPDARLIVGSLWIDRATGALVRAAYRPSVAMDLWPLMEQNLDDSDRDLVRRFGPFRGNVEEIVIEHGLFAERFWLPRTRIAHAEGTAKGGRVTISIEQTFTYEAVHAVPGGTVAAAPPPPITGRERDRGEDARDEYDAWQRGRALDRGCRTAGDPLTDAIPLDTLAATAGLRRRTVAGVRVRMLLPCDREALLRSSALPPSIYSPSEELFTETDLGRLRTEVQSALAMSQQAAWAPQPTRLTWGWNDGLLRYNRIEALSAGMRGEKALGRGLTLDGAVRVGAADLEPNAELAVKRANGRGIVRAAAFRRLAHANDAGDPLGLSASANALLLGNDVGIYYRAAGAELGGTHQRVSGGPGFTWRVFAERHDRADVANGFSFGRLMAHRDFAPNVAATAATYGGGAAALSFARGADPGGAQVSGAVRLEGARGPTDFGRGLVDLRLARGIGRTGTVALVGAVGSSQGTVPPQRRFHLGGPATLHAHDAGALAGDAFWLARAEVARGFPLVRPVLFYDLGWAGDRDTFARSGGRGAAAGLGVAAIDGLVRFDLSRRLTGRGAWALDLFIDVR